MQLGMTLVTFLAFCTIGLRAEHETNNNNSYKDKLISLLNDHGKVGFDETITEEMAQDIYTKHISGEYNNNNNNNNNNGNDESPRRLYNSDGTMTDADRLEMLTIHNNYRSALSSADGTVTDSSSIVYPKSSDMNYLFWDNALESVAQGWANSLASTCNSLVHNSGRSSDFYSYTTEASFEYPDSSIYLGENIAVTWSTSSTVKSTRYTARIDDMWNEKSQWSYQTYSSSTINGAGHFTQMSWADTRYIGCGTYNCFDGTYYRYYLVCNYWPGGNYAGQYPYTSGDCTASSNACDNDRTNPGIDSLCGGCMDPGYVVSGSTSSSTDCYDGFVSVATGPSGPSMSPTEMPSVQPSNNPVASPTTKQPTNYPTDRPSDRPTAQPSMPTMMPSDRPTNNPTDKPTEMPTVPSQAPTKRPTNAPVDGPSIEIEYINGAGYYFAVYLYNADTAVSFALSDNTHDWVNGTGSFVNGGKYKWTWSLGGFSLNYNVRLIDDSGNIVIVYNVIDSYTSGSIWDLGTNFGSSNGPSPTSSPTDRPIENPTQSPSDRPSNSPTVKPSSSPTDRPTDSPIAPPTQSPTNKPSDSPTNNPIPSPTQVPTDRPTDSPTVRPTSAPTDRPTKSPIDSPTTSPTDRPSNDPTAKPTLAPTDRPTSSPIASPSTSPTNKPSNNPTVNPSGAPTNHPTNNPVAAPTTSPTDRPTNSPTKQPSYAPTDATPSPSMPTVAPTDEPTNKPSASPSDMPTDRPTMTPSNHPTDRPSFAPTDSTLSPTMPSIAPTDRPSQSPTDRPTMPTIAPTSPTVQPTSSPVSVSAPTSAPISIVQLNNENFYYMKIQMQNVASGWSLSGVKVRDSGSNPDPMWHECTTPNDKWSCGQDLGRKWVIPFDVELTGTDSNGNTQVLTSYGVIDSLARNDIADFGQNFVSSSAITSNESGSGSSGSSGVSTMFIVGGIISLVFVVGIVICIAMFCCKRNKMGNNNNNNNNNKDNDSGSGDIENDMVNTLELGDTGLYKYKSNKGGLKEADVMSPEQLSRVGRVIDDDDDDDNNNNDINNYGNGKSNDCDIVFGSIIEGEETETEQLTPSKTTNNKNIKLEESITIGFSQLADFAKEKENKNKYKNQNNKNKSKQSTIIETIIETPIQTTNLKGIGPIVTGDAVLSPLSKSMKRVTGKTPTNDHNNNNNNGNNHDGPSTPFTPLVNKGNESDSGEITYGVQADDSSSE